MVTQILNFGVPAPIDVQIQGNDVHASLKVADELLREFRQVPGLGDLRIQQPVDQPKLHVTVDRTKAAEAGLTQQNVASSMLVTLSGSFQTQPTFWLNPQNGVSYNVAMQAPQYSVQSLQDLQNIPIASACIDAPRDSGRREQHLARQRAGGGFALQPPPRGGCIRVGGRARSGRGGRRHPTHCGRQPQVAAARFHHRHPRTDRDDEDVVSGPDRRAWRLPSCWSIC